MALGRQLYYNSALELVVYCSKWYLPSLFVWCWTGGACVQSIEHPGCVWDAKFLENGDIVTACSDGVVRIWTSNPDRIANPIEIESYSSQLSQYKCSRYTIMVMCIKLWLQGIDMLQWLLRRDNYLKPLQFLVRTWLSY